ncbi:GNAT family N-acetyltransferase [Nitratifractor sp.]|uniref:GNAT family N-acetyltransferase n=1 Tax=Nitratifractor sp. TaxID=2268144 RepID=UPI0025F95EAF|nr:GNAT family N-acetyltransferase [Nitratifractor sp.]
MTPIQSLTPIQIDDLHRLYREQWWTRDRTLEETRSLIANSDIIVGFADAQGHLAAFARVLSDFTIKALIFDLIVDEPHRNKGLGRALLQTISKHPRLSHVRHFELYCLPEMASYYKSSGFKELNHELILMRKDCK